MWERAEGRRYSAALLFYRFSPDGQFIGTQSVTLNIEFAAGADEFTATIAFEVLGLDGNAVETGNATAVGQRM